MTRQLTACAILIIVVALVSLSSLILQPPRTVAAADDGSNDLKAAITNLTQEIRDRFPKRVNSTNDRSESQKVIGRWKASFTDRDSQGTPREGTVSFWFLADGSYVRADDITTRYDASAPHVSQIANGGTWVFMDSRIVAASLHDNRHSIEEFTISHGTLARTHFEPKSRQPQQLTLTRRE